MSSRALGIVLATSLALGIGGAAETWFKSNKRFVAGRPSGLMLALMA
ncbi:hypothetical protein [Microbispora sp. GKU 823]|nr:hypothetical protein [Microbispora sp. GKU 823]